MKKMGLLSMMIGLALVFAACGGGGDSSNGESSNNDNSQTASVDAEAAQKVFKQNCATCHGENLEGKNGPALDHIGKEMSEKEIHDQIKNGTKGQMPGGLIKGDEANNVAAWLATKK